MYKEFQIFCDFDAQVNWKIQYLVDVNKLCEKRRERAKVTDEICGNFKILYKNRKLFLMVCSKANCMIYCQRVVYLLKLKENKKCQHIRKDTNHCSRSKIALIWMYELCWDDCISRHKKAFDWRNENEKCRKTVVLLNSCQIKPWFEYVVGHD